MGRERKRVVFLIFEGISDYDALYIPISRLYEEVDESIEVMYGFIEDKDQECGDITSKNGVKPENIEEIMTKIIFVPNLNRDGVYPKDLLEVIHFIDMDGSYVSDDTIVFDANCIKTEYSDKIYTNDKKKIVERNIRKRANIDYLTEQSQIKVKSKKIDYSIYYCSSNLEHVSSNKANVDASDKRGLAKLFAHERLSSSQDFLSFFESVMPPVTNDEYKDTWSFIKDGNNSLGRYSNVAVLIRRLMGRADAVK